MIAGLGVLTYFLTINPEKFAKNPHQETSASADSSKIVALREKYQPVIDSLEHKIVIDPNDFSSHLLLADYLSDCEYWDRAKEQFDIYLRAKPEDADARVDYALVITQMTGDFDAGIEEIERALKYDPDHIKALFNEGMLTLGRIQTSHDADVKTKAIALAIPYFRKALASAKKQQDEKTTQQISQILEKLEVEGK